MKLIASALLLTLTACANPVEKAVRDVKYSAYEMVGVQKRDLLKKRITETREDQKEAGASFEDALDKMRKLYGMGGSELETKYRSLKSSYDSSNAKVSEVHRSHEQMDTVAGDLFKEWKGEIGQMQDEGLIAASQKQLRETQSRFDDMTRKLSTSETKMNGVLKQLNDHVLFLKHNLNAQSVASLKNEQSRIEGNIQGALKEMNAAIKDADEFIRTIK